MSNSRRTRNQLQGAMEARMKRQARRREKEKAQAEGSPLTGAGAIMAALSMRLQRRARLPKWCDYTGRFGPTVRLPNGCRINRDDYEARTVRPRRVARA